MINAQEGTTKALRQWRFAHVKEIEASVVLEYVKEAIDNERAGKKIKPEKKALVIPEELQEAFLKDSKLLSRFEEMSLLCKREYAGYISEAKKEETRLRRLEKILPMILNGKGLNDNYR